MFPLRCLPWIAFVLITLFLGCQQRAEAQTLHLLAVCDTTDQNIGESVANDCVLVEKELKSIAKAIDFDFKPHLLTGEQTLPANVVREIKKLKVAADDTLFFYFSGHGYHLESEASQRWPHFYFSRTGEGLPMADIERSLTAKKARLTCLFSDCCNNLIPDAMAPQDHKKKKAMAVATPPTIEIENYKKLFRDTRGLIIATGAREGEYASCTPLGGFFTYTFFTILRNISKAGEGDIVSWQELLKLSETLLVNFFEQTPDFEVQSEQR